MDERQKVNLNTIFNAIKSIFGIIYPLVTFPYISRVLMAENVGKINFGSSIVSYFTLIASLGITTYAVRECSKVKENKAKLQLVSSQIFSINIISTLVAYAALTVTLIVARPLYNYRIMICIQSTTILFTTLGADWLNTAMEDFRFIAVRTMSMQIVSLILMFVFVRKPENYIIYAVISVVASSGANIVNIIYRRRYCNTRFTLKMDLKKHILPIFLLFSLIFSQTIYTNSDTTILGLIRGDFEVGLYSTTVKIYNLVNTVVASVTWVVIPQLSSSFYKKDYDKVNSLLKYALNFILVLGIPCIIGINVITKHIILVLGGSEYLGATTALHILTISLACSFVGGWIGNMMMLPAGREKICLKSAIISALLNIILNLILIPLWGLNAAALTTAISELVGIFVKLPYIDKRIKIQGLKEMMKCPIIGGIEIIIIGLIVSNIFASSFLIVLTLIVYKNDFFLSFFNPVINKFKRRINK